jgi:sec-independent protein translocase protein TatA
VNFPGGWELVLVVLVIMVLFGAKRLPEASRSLGRSMRIFKAETKGLRDDDEPKTTTTTTALTETYVPAPVAPPAPIVPPTAVVPPVGEQPRQP